MIYINRPTHCNGLFLLSPYTQVVSSIRSSAEVLYSLQATSIGEADRRSPSLQSFRSSMYVFDQLACSLLAAGISFGNPYLIRHRMYCTT